MTTFYKKPAWEFFIFCRFLQYPHQVDMKKVKCWIEFYIKLNTIIIVFNHFRNIPWVVLTQSTGLHFSEILDLEAMLVAAWGYLWIWHEPDFAFCRDHYHGLFLALATFSPNDLKFCQYFSKLLGRNFVKFRAKDGISL